ncbi:MAG: hypothetical protein LBJ39_03815 [Tannerellaceae bacterium]|nr:hypothetical protein [Tannerellaceae bacterium]
MTPLGSGFTLQFLSPLRSLPGFPLQSLTRRYSRRHNISHYHHTISIAVMWHIHILSSKFKPGHAEAFSMTHGKTFNP